MSAPEKKYLTLKPDKLYFLDGFDHRNDYSAKIVDERFNGTFKEAFRSLSFEVSILIPKNKEKPTYSNLQSSWTKHISTDRLLGDQLDALFDKYLLYYVVRYIFEILDSNNEKSFLGKENNITFECDPNDVDRFIKYMDRFPDLPEIGQWSGTIIWVSDFS